MNDVIIELSRQISQANNQIERVKLLPAIFRVLQQKYGVQGLAFEFNTYRNDTFEENIDFIIITDILNRALLD